METTRISMTHLRAWRVYRLLSQRELAKISGLNKATVMSLENDQYRANFGTVRKLAAALKIEPEELAWTAPNLPDEQLAA